jgi:hypothetical protein
MKVKIKEKYQNFTPVHGDMQIQSAVLIVKGEKELVIKLLSDTLKNLEKSV